MKNKFFASDNAMAANLRSSSGDGVSLAHIGKGLLLAGVLLVLFSLALAAAYCYTSLTSGTAHLLQLFVLAAAAFVGGFSAARGAGRKGLWHGLALAILFLLVLVAANLAGLTASTAEGISLLALLVKGMILLLAGGLGGIFGVA